MDKDRNRREALAMYRVLKGIQQGARANAYTVIVSEQTGKEIDDVLEQVEKPEQVEGPKEKVFKGYVLLELKCEIQAVTARTEDEAHLVVERVYEALADREQGGEACLCGDKILEVEVTGTTLEEK